MSAKNAAHDDQSQIWVSQETLNKLWQMKPLLFPGRAVGSISHDDVIQALLPDLPGATMRLQHQGRGKQ